MATIIWGVIRIVPVESATHATAQVEQQLRCVNNGDSGVTCNIRVGFYDGSRFIRAIVMGANPGQITSNDGQRVLQIYFQPNDPYHPHQLAEDAVNDSLLIGVGIILVVIALTMWIKERAKRARRGELDRAYGDSFPSSAKTR
jgi:hypothetical protein